MVGFAKDPWRLKATIGSKIIRDEGQELETDEEKANHLALRNFKWTEEARVGEEEEVEARHWDRGLLVEKIHTALQGTSNKSAPGPDGASYKLVKLAVKGPLEDALFEQITEELSNGIMPEEWQACKVVMIPKPGKDHREARVWRPINFFNCVGKLAEKVVANDLQQIAGLFHKYQFGCRRGRSTIEALFRAVVRSQRCLAKGGGVVWVMEDVQGGFQNVQWEVVRDRIKGTAAEGWLGWLKTFFRKREFTIEWDGKKRGQGRTNVGAPQGSPLSPVLFLIYMAPILEEMEKNLIRARLSESPEPGSQKVRREWWRS